MNQLKVSRQNLVLLGILALGTLSALLFYRFLLPRAEDDLIRWQDEAAQAQRVIREAGLTDLDALRQELAQARAELARAGFPPESQALQVTSVLARQAQENGLQLKIGLQRSLQKVGTGTYALYLHQVEAVGEPEGLTRFLQSLEDSEWPGLLMDKIGMVPDGGSWKLTLEVRLYAQPRVVPAAPAGQ